MILVLGYAHIKSRLDGSAARALLHARRLVPTHGSRHRRAPRPDFQSHKPYYPVQGATVGRLDVCRRVNTAP